MLFWSYTEPSNLIEDKISGPTVSSLRNTNVHEGEIARDSTLPEDRELARGPKTLSQLDLRVDTLDMFGFRVRQKVCLVSHYCVRCRADMW